MAVVRLSQLPLGKVPPELLVQRALSRLGAPRDEVIVRPSLGVDAAALAIPGGIAVVSSDPITGAQRRAGWLAVHVACNDIAVMGAEPVGILATILLTRSSGDSDLEQFTLDIDEACRDLGIAVLGGHTEVTSAVTQPVLMLTAMGVTDQSRLIRPGVAEVGDTLLLVGAAAIEGTAILATEFADELSRALGAEQVESAQQFWREISIVAPALAAARSGAKAMHDVTEGGVVTALDELGRATGLGVRVNVEEIPRRAVTDAICSHFGLDPLALISSGALLIATEQPTAVETAVRATGSACVAIGELVRGPSRLLTRGKSLKLIPPARDELWRFYEERL